MVIMILLIMAIIVGLVVVKKVFHKNVMLKVSIYDVFRIFVLKLNSYKYIFIYKLNYNLCICNKILNLYNDTKYI